jgi:hypothetical protein
MSGTWDETSTPGRRTDGWLGRTNGEPRSGEPRPPRMTTVVIRTATDRAAALSLTITRVRGFTCPRVWVPLPLELQPEDHLAVVHGAGGLKSDRAVEGLG